MKHTSGKTCASCEKKLQEGHPDLHYWYHRIKEAFPDCHVAWCWRGEVDQNDCLKRGTTKLKFPTSKHNHCKEGKNFSLAMDLFRQDEEGNGIWRTGYFVQIAHFLIDHNAPITWGGDFKTPDPPHFEVKGTT